jgi:hypothetical protein
VLAVLVMEAQLELDFKGLVLHLMQFLQLAAVAVVGTAELMAEAVMVVQEVVLDQTIINQAVLLYQDKETLAVQLVGITQIIILLAVVEVQDRLVVMLQTIQLAVLADQGLHPALAVLQLLTLAAVAVVDITHP